MSRTGLRSSKRKQSVSKDTWITSVGTTLKARPRRTQTAMPPARAERRSSRSILMKSSRQNRVAKTIIDVQFEAVQVYCRNTQARTFLRIHNTTFRAYVWDRVMNHRHEGVLP
ncbi:unnamed protein product [Trichogramma brassicae]|uniref:Uncharacterized protein n=1 Tax=Trichogramma brassicae TaxID=86971 RepID=A0A6H5IS24_9HYME|nr:unnamed protein product [Trichogramma brassicae]